MEISNLQNLVRSKVVTLNSNGWKASGANFEYTITDDNVTSEMRVDCYLDIDNEKKLNGGYYYTDSYNGGYKIISTAQPTDTVEIHIYIQKVVNV